MSVVLHPAEYQPSPELSAYFEAVRLHMRSLVSDGRSTSTTFESTSPVEPQVADLLNCSQKIETIYSNLWSENLCLVLEAADSLKLVLAYVSRCDSFRLEQHLQADLLVATFARLFEMIHSRYSRFLPTKILHLIDCITSILNSLLKSSFPITQESFQKLLDSLIPFHLELVNPKVESFTSSLFSRSDLNALLLALLQLAISKVEELNKNPREFGSQVKVVTEWIEIVGALVSQSSVGGLNLDSIFMKVHVLIDGYPKSQLELERDFRLLESLRELVFKICTLRDFREVIFWYNLKNRQSSGLNRYIKCALQQKPLMLSAFVNPIVLSNPSPDAQEDILERLSASCVPLILGQDFEPDCKDVMMFRHLLSDLASSTDLARALRSLDSLVCLYEDFVVKAQEDLELHMDLLIRACARQYRLFVIKYFQPRDLEPSEEALQLFCSNTYLLEQIFASSNSQTFLDFVSIETCTELILLIFSFQLDWSRNLSLDLKIRDSSILLGLIESMERSKLICICVRLLRYFKKKAQKKNANSNIFDKLDRCAKEMLYELTMPLQFAEVEMLEAFDFEEILWQVDAYMKMCDWDALHKEFNKVLTPPVDRLDDSRTLTILTQLLYDLLNTNHHLILSHIGRIQQHGPVYQFLEQMLNRLGLSCTFIHYKYDEAAELKVSFQVQLATSTPDHILEGVMQLRHRIKVLLNEHSVVDHFDVILEQVNIWTRQYEHYIAYEDVRFDVINLLTWGCREMLFKMYREEDWQPLGPLFHAIGILFNQMYGQSESVGHEYTSKSGLIFFMNATFVLILPGSSRQRTQIKLIEESIRWVHPLIQSLIANSKLHYHLLFALQILYGLMSLNAKYDWQDVVRATQIVKTMLQCSCEQMFLRPTEAYVKQLDSKELNLSEFLLLADKVLGCYPVSYLERERDYSIWELLKRVLCILFDRNHWFIRDYYDKIEDQSDSPVIAFFEAKLKLQLQAEVEEMRKQNEEQDECQEASVFEGAGFNLEYSMEDLMLDDDDDSELEEYEEENDDEEMIL